jgi:hypothetical protein
MVAAASLGQLAFYLISVVVAGIKGHTMSPSQK